MRLRRVSREKALQFLFQHEVNPTDNLGTELDAFWAEQFLVLREERGDIHDRGQIRVEILVNRWSEDPPKPRVGLQVAPFGHRAVQYEGWK